MQLENQRCTTKLRNKVSEDILFRDLEFQALETGWREHTIKFNICVSALPRDSVYCKIAYDDCHLGTEGEHINFSVMFYLSSECRGVCDDGERL